MLAEYVCLALVSEGPSHGWAIGSLLAPDGAVGRVWSLSRPLTYRTLTFLQEKRLITGRVDGRRMILSATSRGRRSVDNWLDTPVSHLRDVRTELLLKLLLRARRGMSAEQFLTDQRQALQAAITALVRLRGGDLVDRWRAENAMSVARFLDITLAGEPQPPIKPLRLSARNQLRGEIENIRTGDLMATVRAGLQPGQFVTAAITKDAVDDLGLGIGVPVTMLIKSTEVLVALGHADSAAD